MKIIQSILVAVMLMCIALTGHAQNDLSKKVADLSKECATIEKLVEQLRSKITKQEEKNKKQKKKLQNNKVFKEQLSAELSKQNLLTIIEKYAKEKCNTSDIISEHQLQMYTNEKYVVIEKKKPDDSTTDMIFSSVEQMPTFPGGAAALMKYLSSHIQYPTMAQENGAQGKVIVQFVVGKDGKVGEVKVVRSVDKELDKEAIRVCKSLPKFVPGRQNGQAVSVWYTLPVTFKLVKNVKKKK